MTNAEKLKNLGIPPFPWPHEDYFDELTKGRPDLKALYVEQELVGVTGPYISTSLDYKSVYRKFVNGLSKR